MKQFKWLQETYFFILNVRYYNGTFFKKSTHANAVKIRASVKTLKYPWMLYNF